MKPSYIRTGGKEEAETYAKRPGRWTVGNLKQSIGWTEEPAIIDYADKSFLLLPETNEFLPAIAVQADSEGGRRAVLEFAGALAWSRAGSVTVENWTGGNRLFRAAKSPKFGQMTAAKFHISYLPEPSNPNQKLALALFHEGTGLAYTHVAYSFLSFYKIINLVSGRSGEEQVDWINAHIGVMKRHRVRERLAELRGKGEDIGTYLYQSCRCAIAHAGDPRNPVIDPHNPEDQKRLHADLPLIITLAEIAIEEIGVQASQTVYREHRYELSGFEELLPANLVELLKAGKTPEDGGLDLPDNLSFRMWGHPPYAPLEEMKPQEVGGENGVLVIRCKTKAEGFYAHLVLDFPNNRLKAEAKFPRKR